MERPITYLALSQLGAVLFGMLFAAAGVRIYTRSFQHDPGMHDGYPVIVKYADWFASYGLLFLVPIILWTLFSLFVSQGRISIPVGDKWLYFSGVALFFYHPWCRYRDGPNFLLGLFPIKPSKQTVDPSRLQRLVHG